MTGTIMKTVKYVAQLFASVTMLLMTVGVSPASAMTMEEVSRVDWKSATPLCQHL